MGGFPKSIKIPAVKRGQVRGIHSIPNIPDRGRGLTDSSCTSQSVKTLTLTCQQVLIFKIIYSSIEYRIHWLVTRTVDYLKKYCDVGGISSTP